MSAKTNDQEVGFDIYHLIDLSDEEGLVWNREFLANGFMDLREQLERALTLMHQGRVENAQAALEAVAEALRRMDTPDPSKVQLLGRWFHGIWAYYYYLVGDFEEAGRALDRAHDSIRNAIERHWFLTSLATHCMDLRIQQARIERNRNRWAAMAENLEISRQMIFGTAPFCVLPSGRPIDMDALARHFEELQLGEKERMAISGFFDENGKRKEFDRHARQMYSLPGLVIQYP